MKKLLISLCVTIDELKTCFHEIKMPKTRKSYTAEKMLMSVAYAEANSNHQTNDKYGMNRRQIINRKREKTVLLQVNPELTALRGGKPYLVKIGRTTQELDQRVNRNPITSDIEII